MTNVVSKGLALVFALLAFAIVLAGSVVQIFQYFGPEHGAGIIGVLIAAVAIGIKVRRILK